MTATDQLMALRRSPVAVIAPLNDWAQNNMPSVLVWRGSDDTRAGGA